jgi:ribonuclease III
MSSGLETLDLEEKLASCEAVLQYQFRDRALLQRCLTHSSVARTRLDSNERLEFLGDAILGTLVCDMLYHRFPEEPEGELTRIKSSLVSRNTCAAITRQCGLQDFLLLGKGLGVGDAMPQSIMAAVFESLVGGVYLDGGLEAVRPFVERVISVEIDRALELTHLKNYKSVLQQVSQKMYGETPVYRLLDEKGPDHSKCFKVSAAIGPQLFPAAWGPNKKEAEQRAALNALHEIEGKDLPYRAD